MSDIIFHSSKLSSVFPKKNPVARFKGLSKDTANASAIAFDLYQHVMTSMKEAHASAVDNILKKEPLPHIGK